MRNGIVLTLLSIGSMAWVSPAIAQRYEYPPEEFAARRKALCSALGDEGTVLMFGKTLAQPGIRFRQDNDFYYLTGNEDLNAAAAIDLSDCSTSLFLVTQTEREASRDGWNWLYQEDIPEQRDFAAIYPLTYLEEFLARKRRSGEQTLYVRMSERTEVDAGRGDIAIFMARRMVNQWGAQPSEDAWRVSMLRERYPYYRLVDVSPHLDAMRMIKGEAEVEALRLNGRVSAEAHRAAIAITRPGAYEYELEAEAAYVMLRNGAEGNGYPAIVGSGPNGLVWHHQDNDRQLQDGDLVVMDYGADLGYQTIDITRTWPVSGAFDELQERAYRCVLEAQKAILAAMKPGVTRAETAEVARAVYQKWGFDPIYAGGAGHFVGMSVHDVGDYSAPLQAGMVIAVEPILEIPEHNIHIRIEDTVLVTENGIEVLSSGVPKEVDEVLALMRSGESR